MSMTAEQAQAYVLLFLLAWGGIALLFGVALGRTMAERDRRENPAADLLPPPAPDRTVELGTRLDVRL